MGSIFGRKHNQTCCCNGICTGCCLCITPPATNVDYIISAPGCPALHLAEGNISGPDAGSETICGSCVGLPNSSNTHEIPTYVWDPDTDPDFCIPQPGGTLQFKFALNCNQNEPANETNPETTEECCRNVRLLLLNPGDSSLIASLPPISCACIEGEGIVATFSLEFVEVDCGLFWTSGPCIGKSKCTQLGTPTGGSCDLTGATVTISQECILSP